MEFVPEKVFILENDSYKELTYEEFCVLKNTSEFKNKKFIGLHGMIMEVSYSEYLDFYRNRRRQKYLLEQSKNNKDVSFDNLTTNEFNGENILIDKKTDVCNKVIDLIIYEKLNKCISLLTSAEKELIKEIFFNGISERELAELKGVSQNAIHKQKKRILAKLKKYLEK